MKQTKFRHDINCFRALAVIAVVIYHFNGEILPAGFIGVDIFFVISGFLMTKIIYQKFFDENFSIAQFYLARAKRIIPALAVMCLVLIIFGWFVLLPDDYALLAKHALSSLSFTSNIVYWTESGYFDLAAKEKWLLHTWSLSLEWQFYILFPIIFYTLLQYFQLSTVKVVFLLSTILLIATSLIITNLKPSLGFYNLPTRAWELLAGSLAFFYPVKATKQQIKWLGTLLIGIIFCCFILLNEQILWPSLYTLIPVTSVATLIALSPSWNITKSAILNFFGDISYSLYLWHWPLTVYLVYSGKSGNLPIVICAICLSVLLAYLSFKYIETPYRKRATLKRSVLFYLAILLAALFVYAKSGATLDSRAISKSEKAEFVSKYKHYKIDPNGYWHKCNTKITHEKTGQFQIDKNCLSEEKETVFLWGDSHAGALSPGIRNVLNKNSQFSQIASSGCHPYFPDFKQEHLRGNGAKACNISNEVAFEYIQRSPPATVILTQAKDFLKYDWEKLAQTLLSMGVKKVFLIGPTPQWQPNLVTAIVNRHWQNKTGYITDPSLDKNIIDMDFKLSSKYNNHEFITYISPIAKLCVKKGKVKCRALIINHQVKTPIIFDYGHLTYEGAIHVAEQAIKPYISKK